MNRLVNSKKFFFLLIGIALIGTSCKTSVNLLLSTNDEYRHSTIIELKDENKQTTEEIDVGIVTADSDKSVKIKMKKDEYFQVKSRMEIIDAFLYSSQDLSIADVSNPSRYEMELSSDIEFLNDSKSAERVEGSLGNIGNYADGEPMGITEAFDNVIGSLVAVVKDTVTGENIIAYSISQSDLKVTKMEYEQIKWRDNSREGETYISGQTANELALNVPVMANFGVAFIENKVYDLKWSVNGYGRYVKPETDARWPSEMIMWLAFEDVLMLKNLIEEKGARVFYMNQAYMVKNAELYIKEAKRIDSSSDQLASVISDKAYSTENSKEIKKSYDDKVLFFWGNEYTFKFKKEKIYTSTKRQRVDYKITYTLRNQNKSYVFPTELFVKENNIAVN